MYLVVAEIRINVRTTADIKRDLEIAARLRGMSVSSLINSLAVKAIREEKNVEPEAFKRAKYERLGDEKEQAGMDYIEIQLPASTDKRKTGTD